MREKISDKLVRTIEHPADRPSVTIWDTEVTGFGFTRRLPSANPRKILGAQSVAYDVAFMQAAKFLPDIIHYLLAIRFRNTGIKNDCSKGSEMTAAF